MLRAGGHPRPVVYVIGRTSPGSNSRRRRKRDEDERRAIAAGTPLPPRRGQERHAPARHAPTRCGRRDAQTRLGRPRRRGCPPGRRTRGARSGRPQRRRAHAQGEARRSSGGAAGASWRARSPVWRSSSPRTPAGLLTRTPAGLLTRTPAAGLLTRTPAGLLTRTPAGLLTRTPARLPTRTPARLLTRTPARRTRTPPRALPPLFRLRSPFGRDFPVHARRPSDAVRAGSCGRSRRWRRSRRTRDGRTPRARPRDDGRDRVDVEPPRRRLGRSRCRGGVDVAPRCRGGVDVAPRSRPPRAPTPTPSPRACRRRADPRPSRARARDARRARARETPRLVGDDASSPSRASSARTTSTRSSPGRTRASCSRRRFSPRLGARRRAREAFPSSGGGGVGAGAVRGASRGFDGDKARFVATRAARAFGLLNGADRGGAAAAAGVSETVLSFYPPEGYLARTTDAPSRWNAADGARSTHSRTSRRPKRARGETPGEAGVRVRRLSGLRDQPRGDGGSARQGATRRRREGARRARRARDEARRRREARRRGRRRREARRRGRRRREARRRPRRRAGDRPRAPDRRPRWRPIPASRHVRARHVRARRIGSLRGAVDAPRRRGGDGDVGGRRGVPGRVAERAARDALGLRPRRRSSRRRRGVRLRARERHHSAREGHHSACVDRQPCRGTRRPCDSMRVSMRRRLRQVRARGLRRLHAPNRSRRSRDANRQTDDKLPDACWGCHRTFPKTGDGGYGAFCGVSCFDNATRHHRADAIRETEEERVADGVLVEMERKKAKNQPGLT